MRERIEGSGRGGRGRGGRDEEVGGDGERYGGWGGEGARGWGKGTGGMSSDSQDHRAAVNGNFTAFIPRARIAAKKHPTPLPTTTVLLSKRRCNDEPLTRQLSKHHSPPVLSSSFPKRGVRSERGSYGLKRARSSRHFFAAYTRTPYLPGHPATLT